MILIIDNYDSFTFNLVQTIGALGGDEEIRVVRNDEVAAETMAAWSPRRLVVSPGPGGPGAAGISVAAIRNFAGLVPILGVCLGHQCIAEVFGARVVRGPRLMHGYTSEVYHDGAGVFEGLPNPMTAMRYHSLVVDPATLPPCLRITARTEMGEIMGLRHETLPIEGVQFHPESFLTPAGGQLLANFVGMPGDAASDEACTRPAVHTLRSCAL